MLNSILPWIRADWTHALVALGAVLFAIATAWGAIKAAYLKTVGHPMPRTRFTLTLDVIAELATNALGAINKVLSARGSTPLFPPAAVPPSGSGAPLVGRPGGSPGRASVGALVALAVGGPVALLLVAAALPGCPSWQRPACPTPGAYRCAGDMPEFCAPSKQWTPAGDEPCARQGRACALDDDGVAFCAATTDGGVR